MKPSQPRCAASWRRRKLTLAQASLERRVERCQKVIGYRFKNRALIREALTIKDSTNQRLALAGDRAADLLLSGHWYRSTTSRGAPLAPRQWAGLKNDLLSNVNLHRAGLRHLGSSFIAASGPSMATTVEAVMGAVWFDSNDPKALESVMQRFGLLTHRLLTHRLFTHSTANPDPDPDPDLEQSPIRSHHHLLARFFNAGQPAARHSHPGLWSRLKSLLFTSKSTVDTAHEHHGLEQHASAPVPATNEQTATPHPGPEPEPGPEPNTTLPAQDAVVQSSRLASPAGRGETFTGWYRWDTEWRRVKHFILTVEKDPSGPKKELLASLYRHRRVLKALPHKSRKNIPTNNPSISGLYLATHSADETRDKISARQIEVLRRLQQEVRRRYRKSLINRNEKARLEKRLMEQLLAVWRDRLWLWLPPTAESGPNSDSPSETPSSDLPVTPAVDSMGTLAALSTTDQRPERPDSLLWTTDVSQLKVHWKHYLQYPTIAPDKIVQSEAHKL